MQIKKDYISYAKKTAGRKIKNIRDSETPLNKEI